MANLYPEIDYGREDDRARVWWLNISQVSDVDPYLADNLISEGEPLAAYYHAGEMWLLVERALRRAYPNRAGVDSPQRGDLVYLDFELNMENPSNQGKYIYDGDRMKELFVTDDELYTFIPDEFQVIIEFPISYWEGRIVGDYFVSFNFFTYFANIGINEIKKRGKYSVYTFFVEEERFEIIYRGDPEYMLERINTDVFVPGHLLPEKVNGFDRERTLILSDEF